MPVDLSGTWEAESITNEEYFAKIIKEDFPNVKFDKTKKMQLTITQEGNDKFRLVDNLFKADFTIYANKDNEWEVLGVKCKGTLHWEGDKAIGTMSSTSPAATRQYKVTREIRGGKLITTTICDGEEVIVTAKKI